VAELKRLGHGQQYVSYRDRHAIADRLAKADPGNAGWQRDLSVSYEKIGDVLVAQGNLPEALKSYRDRHAIADRLAKADLKTPTSAPENRMLPRVGPPGNHTAETALAGWGGRTRTPESVRNKIHLNCRHNFRGIGRNGAPETFRVRAAALGICSSRKDFGRRFQRGRPNSIAAWRLRMPGWSDSNSGMRGFEFPGLLPTVAPQSFEQQWRRGTWPHARTGGRDRLHRWVAADPSAYRSSQACCDATTKVPDLMENSVPARPVDVLRGKTYIGTCDEDRRTRHQILIRIVLQPSEELRNTIDLIIVTTVWK
jgi:hypothetical protein